jgi:membrane-associated protease RseP (regulator of RpoE activity)
MRDSRKLTAGLLVAALVLCGQHSWAYETTAYTGQVTFDGDTAILALADKQVHPRVIVELGDDAQHQFIVDTGASVNVIDVTIAQSYGFEVIGETEIGAPGGPQIAADIVRIPLFSVGDAVVVDAEFVTMDILGFTRGTTKGVLGTGLFGDYLLTFDRGAGQIILSRATLSADDAGVLPYDSEGSQIGIEILVAGSPLVAHVDTGSMGRFTLPGEMMASLPVSETQSTGQARLVGGNREIKTATLDGTIQFAGLQFENPDIAFMTPSSGTGNIGSAVMLDYVVSIDQQNHLISFKESPAGKFLAAKKPRRLGVQFKGMPGGSVLTIASVHSGSIAEQAGLKSGDVLLILNGKPTEQYEMAELATLFGGDSVLNLELERDGEARNIEIK